MALATTISGRARKGPCSIRPACSGTGGRAKRRAPSPRPRRASHGWLAHGRRETELVGGPRGNSARLSSGGGIGVRRDGPRARRAGRPSAPRRPGDADPHVQALQGMAGSPCGRDGLGDRDRRRAPECRRAGVRGRGSAAPGPDGDPRGGLGGRRQPPGVHPRGEHPAWGARPRGPRGVPLGTGRGERGASVLFADRSHGRGGRGGLATVHGAGVRQAARAPPRPRPGGPRMHPGRSPRAHPHRRGPRGDRAGHRSVSACQGPGLSWGSTGADASDRREAGSRCVGVVIPSPENPLVVALDVSDLERAESLARAVGPAAAMVKVGLELFTAHGPGSVVRIQSIAPVFLDLKLHDIPTTVERAARNAARLGVAMLTVHAMGGEAMMAAAVRGATQGSEEAGRPSPAVAAVTVLSSLSGESLASPGSLAFEARAAGAAGAVVSGEDVAVVREVTGEEFCLIVPGIRPAGSNGHDQLRILTPEEALAAGADYLVIGRPITEANDPAGAARSILATIR